MKFDKIEKQWYRSESNFKVQIKGVKAKLFYLSSLFNQTYNSLTFTFWYTCNNPDLQI